MLDKSKTTRVWMIVCLLGALGVLPLSSHASMIETPVSVGLPIVSLGVRGAARVPAGQTSEYTITYHIESKAAHAVLLTASIPDAFEFQAASDHGEYNNETGECVWTLGTIQPGTDVVSLRLSAKAPVRDETAAALQAQMDTAENEPIAAEKTITVTSAPRLTVSHAVDPAQVTAGSRMLVSHSVTNSGTDAARSVLFRETLPEGFKLASGNSSVEQRIGELAAGKSMVIKYELLVADDAAAGDHSFTATLTAENHANLAVTWLQPVAAVPALAALPDEPSANAENEPSVELPAGTAGQVLGASTELATTGFGFRDWLLVMAAVFLITFGLTMLRFYPYRRE